MMAKITKEDAIFCEKSYIGETNCIDCKYYATDACISRESHRMAVKALEQESVLDKIRAEIKEKFEGYDICEWFEDYDYEENNISEYRSVGNIGEILDIIDKYKESVTPTCKKGHWIEVDTNMYTCSNCSHCFEIVPEVNSIHQFKCCPNCKTEMESKE